MILLIPYTVSNRIYGMSEATILMVPLKMTLWTLKVALWVALGFLVFIFMMAKQPQ